MTRLKVLVLSDLDGQILRVNRLCDRIVCSADGDVTAVIVSGGLVAPGNPRAYDTLEEVAAAEGDMMALVARLETIVCRVVYIPDDNDPPTTRSRVVPPPALTQYSANVFAHAQPLAAGVVVMGEAHYLALLNAGKDPTDGHDLVLVLRDAAARTQLPAPHGSFRVGQFTILELEKESRDAAWRIAATTAHHTLALSDDEDSDGDDWVRS